MNNFSPRTIMAAIDALEWREHSQIDGFLLYFSLRGIARQGGIRPRQMAVMEHISDHGNDRGPDGGPLAREVVQYVLNELGKRASRTGDAEAAVPTALVCALAKDGYAIRDGVLVSAPRRHDPQRLEGTLQAIMEHLRQQLATGAADELEKTLIRPAVRHAYAKCPSWPAYVRVEREVIQFLETAHGLKVFVSHAPEDRDEVGDLVKYFLKRWVNPWVPVERILPGQDRDVEIRQAVRDSDAVLVCLSRRSVTEAGCLQREIDMVLDVAEEKPEGAIVIIPVRLEECEVPERVRGLQPVDLGNQRWDEALGRALEALAFRKFRQQRGEPITPPAESTGSSGRTHTPPVVGDPFADGAQRLSQIQPGSEDASTYHRLVADLLEYIFDGQLRNRTMEEKINGGRKRVDIAFTNSAKDGFFQHLAVDHPVCRYVFIECKNYANDPKNPEVDQLLGRLSPKRGKFGFLVCRTIQNKDLLFKRCKDAVHDDDKYILVLDDQDIKCLLGMRLRGAVGEIDDYLDRAFRKLVM